MITKTPAYVDTLSWLLRHNIIVGNIIDLIDIHMCIFMNTYLQPCVQEIFDYWI